jgi:polar amino acid transport system substrate-binding protein
MVMRLRVLWLLLITTLTTTLTTTLATTLNAAELKLYSTIEPPQQMESGGQLTGIGIDVVEAIQARLGRQQEVTIYPWARALAIARKNSNSAIFLGGMNEDRRQDLIAVGPVMKKRYILYRRANSPLRVDGLDAARRVGLIATMHDDIRQRFLLREGFENLKSTTDHIEGLRLLLNGRVDLWANSDWELGSNASRAGITEDALEVALELYRADNHILINRHSDPELIARWRSALRTLKEDGTMQAIASKWGERLGLALRFDREADAIMIGD